MEVVIFSVCVIGVPIIALIGFIVSLVKFIKLRKTDDPNKKKYELNMIGLGVTLLVSGTIFGLLLGALISLGNAFSDGINNM